MGAFISRQPNGLLCRFSSVTDTVTHYNMTDDEYIKMRQERAAEEARELLKRHTKPFYMVRESFWPNNMSRSEFNEILKEMERPKNEIQKKTEVKS